MDKYQEQLDMLEEKFIVLDGDCILLFLNKVIESNFDVNKVADPNYVAQTIFSMHKEEVVGGYFDEDSVKERKQKIKAFVEKEIDVLEKILIICHRNLGKDLDEIFSIHGVDIPWFIDDAVAVDLDCYSASLKQCQRVCQIIDELIQIKALEDTKDIRCEQIDILAKFGFDKCEQRYSDYIEKYPDNLIQLYTAVADRMLVIDRNRKEYQKLYNLILNTPIVSQEEQQYYDEFFEAEDEFDDDFDYDNDDIIN